MIDRKKQYDRQNDYAKKTYDRIHLVLPKGCKDRLKAVAEERKISMNELIIREIEKYF